MMLPIWEQNRNMQFRRCEECNISCRQEDRVVGNDNTVRYRGLSLQLPASPLRPHFVKARIRVHHYPDSTLAVFHGPRRLAQYHADGRPIEEQMLAA